MGVKPAMKRKESRASLNVLPTGEKVMTINRQVSKTVKDAQGKDFKRTANITFEVPEKLDDLGSLVTAFGSVQKLAEAAFYGVWRKAQLDATNELMKGDKASKALKKMAAGIKAVMPNLTDEAAIALILSNPSVAEAFKSEPLTAEIAHSVNPATQVIPSLNDAEPEESEDDEPAKETTVA